MTTADLDAAAAEVIRKHGGTAAFLHYGNPPYPATLCVSVNEELVHGIPGKRKLKEGDIVSVDCGTVLEGFVGDSAFTAGVGEISSEAQRLLDVTEQALAIGISKMRTGNRTGDVSAAIQANAEGAGLLCHPGIYRARGRAGVCTRARRCRIMACLAEASLSARG